MENQRDVVELFARCNVYEFLLEILFAREWSGFSAEEAHEAKTKMLNLMIYRSHLSPNADPQSDLLAFQEQFAAVADNLLGKALKRSEEIRTLEKSLRDRQS